MNGYVDNRCGASISTRRRCMEWPGALLMPGSTARYPLMEGEFANHIHSTHPPLIPLSHSPHPPLTLYSSPSHTLLISLSHSTHLPLTLYSSPSHTLLISLSHSTHPPLTLYSSSSPTLLIPLSHSTHPPLTLYSSPYLFHEEPLSTTYHRRRSIRSCCELSKGRCLLYSTRSSLLLCSRV